MSRSGGSATQGTSMRKKKLPQMPVPPPGKSRWAISLPAWLRTRACRVPSSRADAGDLDGSSMMSCERGWRRLMSGGAISGDASQGGGCGSIRPASVLQSGREVAGPAVRYARGRTRGQGSSPRGTSRTPATGAPTARSAGGPTKPLRHRTSHFMLARLTLIGTSRRDPFWELFDSDRGRRCHASGEVSAPCRIRRSGGGQPAGCRFSSRTGTSVLSHADQSRDLLTDPG